jgi:hypothetical protein
MLAMSNLRSPIRHREVGDFLVLLVVKHIINASRVKLRDVIKGADRNGWIESLNAGAVHRAFLV